MSEYEDLKAFWDQLFNYEDDNVIKEKWIMEESFNRIVNEYIKPNSKVLDYGCGSGWLLLELYFTIQGIQGVGIDPSRFGIEHAYNTQRENKIDSLTYICSDQRALDQYENYFDTIMTLNVIDVLPDDIILDILKQFLKSLKQGGYLLLGINPDYPKELLEKVGYQFKDSKLYKDGILRGNDKTNEEWIELFETYFEFVKLESLCLIEKEHEYPRRLFVLRKK